MVSKRKTNAPEIFSWGWCHFLMDILIYLNSHIFTTNSQKTFAHKKSKEGPWPLIKTLIWDRAQPREPQPREQVKEAQGHQAHQAQRSEGAVVTAPPKQG